MIDLRPGARYACRSGRARSLSSPSTRIPTATVVIEPTIAYHGHANLNQAEHDGQHPTHTKHPLVGPEVISGSTRMKAGTATKTVAWLALRSDDAEPAIVSRGAAGGTNPQAVGFDRAMDNLGLAVEAARRDACVPRCNRSTVADRQRDWSTLS